MSATTLVQKLEAIVNEKHLTKHPFYQLWDQGKLTKEQLAKYARQYYHLEATFPQYLSLIHSKCDDLQIRRALTENLYEEEVEDVPHSKLWIQFEEALGVPSDQVANAQLLPETHATISMIKNICGTKSVEEGIAAMFAYEAMLPEVSRRKIDGLKKHYGVTDEKAIAFFVTHMSADAKHSNVWINLLERKSYDEANLEVAVHEACNAMNLFLDGVTKAYVQQHPICV